VSYDKSPGVEHEYTAENNRDYCEKKDGEDDDEDRNKNEDSNEDSNGEGSSSSDDKEHSKNTGSNGKGKNESGKEKDENGGYHDDPKGFVSYDAAGCGAENTHFTDECMAIFVREFKSRFACVSPPPRSAEAPS